MNDQALRRAIRQLPQLVWHSAAWHSMARSTLGSWHDVILAEALARHPRQTVAGYERYLQTFTPSALERILNILIQHDYFATARGKYWALPEYQVIREAWHTASQTVMQHWQPDDCLTVAHTAETLCNAIPLDQLATHQRYAYGVRPQPEADPQLRGFVACWAWQNYEADVRAFAWQQVGIKPTSAMLLREFAAHATPLERETVLDQTKHYLADDAGSLFDELANQQWIHADADGWRMTATGWGFWHESRTVIETHLMPLLAQIDDNQRRACGDALGRIIGKTPSR